MPYSNQFAPPGTSTSERVLVGLLLLTSALVFLLLQIFILILFMLYRDFRSHLCYRIMIAISVVDSVQLVALAYGGLILLFNNSFNPWLEKALGGLLSSINCCDWPLGLVLAMNRLLVFWPHKISANAEKRLINGLLTISLIWGLAPFPIYLTPGFTVGFRFYSWIYMGIAADLEWLLQFSQMQTFPFLGLTLLTYLVILGVMINQRAKISSSSALRGTTTTNGPTQLAAHELRLLLQAVAQFLVEISLCALWSWQMVCGMCTGGRLGTIFLSWYWIFMCGFKPLLYIMSNKLYPTTNNSSSNATTLSL